MDQQNERRPKRDGFKWTVNELLSLERGHDLLHLSIEDLAKKHQRSVRAITFKLEELEKEKTEQVE